MLTMLTAKKFFKFFFLNIRTYSRNPRGILMLILSSAVFVVLSRGSQGGDAEHHGESSQDDSVNINNDDSVNINNDDSVNIN